MKIVTYMAAFLILTFFWAQHFTEAKITYKPAPPKVENIKPDGKCINGVWYYWIRSYVGYPPVIAPAFDNLTKEVILCQ